MVEWSQTNIPEGLTVFAFPDDHQRRIRTSNPLERTNKEIRRRTRVATIDDFDTTRATLTTWFEAAWHISTAKNGMSAKKLERTLGTS